MKRQRFIHFFTPPLYIIAALVAWHYVPPYLAANPGILFLLAIFIVSEIAHFFLHDK